MLQDIKNRKTKSLLHPIYTLRNQILHDNLKMLLYANFNKPESIFYIRFCIAERTRKHIIAATEI